MHRKDFSQRKHCTVGCGAESVELVKGSEWLVCAVTGRLPAKGPLPQPFRYNAGPDFTATFQISSCQSKHFHRSEAVWPSSTLQTWNTKLNPERVFISCGMNHLPFHGGKGSVSSNKWVTGLLVGWRHIKNWTWILPAAGLDIQQHSNPLGGQFMILISAAEVTLLIVTQGITNVGCYLFLVSLTFRRLLANTLCSALCAVVNFLVGATKKYLTKATSGSKHLFWLRVCRDTSPHGSRCRGQLATLHPQAGRREQRCWFSAGLRFMQSRIQSQGIEMSTIGVGLCISIILI